MLGGCQIARWKKFGDYFLHYMKVCLDFMKQGVEIYVITVADFIFDFKTQF